MNRELFNHKMTRVAELLSLTWELQEEAYDNRGYLLGSNEEQIFVCTGGYQNKSSIRISSSYPRDARGQYTAYEMEISINVVETKTADQIAKDIQRRFLPQHRINLAVVQEKIRQSNKYMSDRLANITQIADHFGWELSGQDQETIYCPIDGVYRIEALNDMNVKFDVQCRPTLAIKILELLKMGGN